MKVHPAPVLAAAVAALAFARAPIPTSASPAVTPPAAASRAADSRAGAPRATTPGAAAPFELRKGDRICLLGNGLADRMQHHGWLETMLQTRFPDHGLVVRNLGFAGDELTVHQRTMNFGKLPGDPMGMDLQNTGYVVWDRYLAHCKANVVFAFFGFNESFAGKAGVAKFKTDLAGFVDHVVRQKYDGKAASRLVLFSPTPHENLRDPILPDGVAANARMSDYTLAMEEVAKAKAVRFVDLMLPMMAEFANAREPLTINGIHLKEAGNEVLARVIDRALFEHPVSRDPGRVAKVRAMVLDKNFHWHQRYRVTDGYNVYGGRSKKVYVAKDDGHPYANYDVLQEEMRALDVMTGNRDAAIHKLARGEDAVVDDGNLPKVTPVKTNKPGTGPGGAHEYISGEAAIAKMTPAKGMKVNLFADEKQFPELVNPVQMAWDIKGRLWVAVWPTYPHWRPGTPRADKLLIFEDTDHDGRADKCKTFASGLLNPTGFEFWNGGVYVAAAPDILFLKDTDGDDVADVRERVLHGLSSADTHHTANSFVVGPDGALYFQEGTFHQSQIESIYGPVRNHNACVWRFHPRTWRVERYIPYNFANPHGHVFDAWGQDFMTDGTGNVNYYALPFSGYIEHPQKHRGYFPFFRQRSRPCAGTEILSSAHFPKENQGNLLIANVIGFLGIFQYRFVDSGSGFTAEEVEPLVSSTDPNFRPSDIEVGADGAVYFLDWHNAIIGHLQHHIRDPSRDTAHGRVYRVTCPKRRFGHETAIAGMPASVLVHHLSGGDDRARYRTRIGLSALPDAEVLKAAKRLLFQIPMEHESYDRIALEMLWLFQQRGRVDLDVLRILLRRKNPNVRAAATRVLRDTWRDVPDAADLLRRMASDPHPRVRLEAIVAASFFDSEAAAAAALEALRRPTDKFIDYALKETLRALEPRWKAALQAGRSVVAADNRAGVEFLLGRVSAGELAKLPRLPAVLAALMTRHGVDKEARLDAAVALAKSGGTTPAAEILRTIQHLDHGAHPHAAHVLHDLGSLLASQVAGGAKIPRDAIVELAVKGRRPATRRLGYAMLIAIDGSADAAWARATRTRDGLSALLGGVGMVADGAVRGSLFAKIRPLMFALPAELRQDAAARHGQGLSVDYYNPAPRDATLAEFAKHRPTKSMVLRNFELDISAADRGGSFGMRYRGTLRVPKKGRYVFFLNSDDGSRLFIGTRNVVDNDGHHGMVERRGAIQLNAGTHPITVTYFDQAGNDGLRVSWRGPGFRKQKIPDELLTTDDSVSLRHAAIRAMAFVPGHEAEKFIDAARLIGENSFLDPAVELLRAVPEADWPKNRIHPVVDTLSGLISGLPPTERTTPRVVAALQFGKRLARALPRDVADAALRRLDGLGGSVVLVRTIPHKMLYDTSEFFVEAGKPVAIVIQNNDLMPHNMVITRPGRMAAVGRAAELLDGKGSLNRRNFIPESEDVLWHSMLLYPGTSERITFVAPKDPADYPYVCTYPGHWRVMNGTMHVVAKLDPERHVAKRTEAGSSVPTRKFVKNWSMDDFAGAFVEGWAKGRDTARGRRLFVEGGCVKCHVVGGREVGGHAAGGSVTKLGPDLLGVAKRYRGSELLRQVLEPSKTVLEGYENHYLEIEDGEAVLGRIVKEDAKSVYIATNFDKPDELTVIAKSRIAERLKATISTMPTGLVVTFVKGEVLDLVAYLESLR